MLGLKKAAARDARIWSNRELHKFAPFCQGSVINVSGWEDKDKEGRTYGEYFSGADSYTVSNYEGWRGSNTQSDLIIDLEEPPAQDLVGAFDVVFNHTTLEHIFDIHLAFRILCDLSKDLVIIVVPFVQHLHGPEDGDFWRPSPYALRRMFARNNMEILYESAGPENKPLRYLFYVASKNPGKWTGTFPKSPGNAEAVLRKAL